MSGRPASGRAQALIANLQLAPHPEGGWYREIFRGAGQVRPVDARGPARHTLTSIDFLLLAGQCSAWHRVAADEAWHLLEGGPLRLWLVPPDLRRVFHVDLAPADAEGRRPRHVVPSMWWQAAEPVADGPFRTAGSDAADAFAYEPESFSIMPAHHAKSCPLVVANARHSPGYACALRLDRPPFCAPLGHARNPLRLYVGATVGPGFDFADFTFGRDDPALRQALQALQPDTLRLL